MTAVKSVTSKPLTGFEKKKTLEHFGCDFAKVPDLQDPKAQVWVCVWEGQEIGRSRLQIDCVNQAIDALGGE